MKKNDENNEKNKKNDDLKRKGSTIEEKEDENRDNKKKKTEHKKDNFSPVLDKNKLQEKTRLENLKFARKQTREFLNAAIKDFTSIFYDESLKEDIKNFLEKQSILISDEGELGKLMQNKLRLSDLDQEIISNGEKISKFFKKIKNNSDYKQFDKDTSEQILIGLSKSLELWQEEYTKQVVKDEAWLFLRPYVEQQIIDNDENIKKIINNAMKEIQLLVEDHYEGLNFGKEDEKRHPSCFISYAWPHLLKHPDEWWTQKFILQFVLDLRKAGINAKMDLLHSRYGHDSNNYMLKGVKEDDFVIVIGTKSLYSKYSDENVFGPAIRKELNAIITRIDTDKKYDEKEENKNKRGNRTFLINLSGSMKESIPEDFIKYTVIESFHDGSYLKTLKETVQIMYKQNKKKNDPDNLYKKSWDNVENEQSLKPLIKGIPMNVVQSYYQQSSENKEKEDKDHEEKSFELINNLLKKN